MPKLIKPGYDPCGNPLPLVFNIDMFVIPPFQLPDLLALLDLLGIRSPMPEFSTPCPWLLRQIPVVQPPGV